MDRLDPVQTIAVTEDADALVMSVPMVFLAKRQVLLAGLRGAPFPVVAFRFDRQTAKLTRMGESRLPGSAPYLSVDADERFLLSVANPGASAFVQELAPDGLPKPEPTSSHTGMPKAHCVLARGNVVYVASCDGPAIFQFTLDGSGRMTPLSPPSVAGTGTDDFRHMAISSDGRSLYVISELKGSLTHFAIDPQSGALTHRASVPLADEDCAAADIAIVNGGRHIVTSERRRSTLSVTALGADGSIGDSTTMPTEASPRAMAVAPNGRHLFVAGEQSNAIAIYAVAPDNGALTLLGRTEVGTTPNWITVIPT